MKQNNISENVEILIGQEKAERYAKMLKDGLRGVEGEEDIRLAMFNFLTSLTKEVGINVRMVNERIVLSGGRIDSLFDNVIFEFKKPSHFKTKSGIGEAVGGRKKGGGGGLINYMLSTATTESGGLEDFLRHLSAKIGVGFDGSSFVFVRYVPSETHEISLEELKKKFKEKPTWLPDRIDGAFSQTVQADLKTGLRFLYLHIRAISPRDPLKPENVSKRFGEKSSNFRKHLKILYTHLRSALKMRETHVETLYQQWYDVFGKVYGGMGTATREIQEKLADEYGDIISESGEDLDIQHLIFSIHTYYSIILKFLVSELLSSLHNPFSRQGTTLALTDEKFKSRIKDIVDGEYFKISGIENFFEMSFFEWWIYVWDDELLSTIKEVIQLLEQLEVTTSIIKPELIGDTVKETYHSLMPNSLRHILGEYFTPDWLAEYAIEIAGFNGKLGESLLDPACGSGTFLALAIKKKNLANVDADRKLLIKDILKTVIGFDLNPISVIASKTNYLLTLGDVSNLDFKIKIPVFQCDSILTPTVHAKQSESQKVFTIETVCGTFEVPAVKTHEAVIEILDIVKSALFNKFEKEEFLKKIYAYDKSIDPETAWKLFDNIKRLESAGRNGFWIPILKNAFAPVYSKSQFDFVIGNPPWVSWKSMSKSYRDLTLPIWWSYDIFNKSAYDKATTHDDFAMAFTYVSADHYLKPEGKLCFVISQTFFKSSKGGEGFRKFEITRGGSNIPLRVEKVVDMVAVKPFYEVNNRTAVMLIEKGKPTEYPVPYLVWEKARKIEQTATLHTVLHSIKQTDLVAKPIGGTNTEKGRRTPWLTLPASEISNSDHIIGESAYSGRKGVEPSGGKGIYVLQEPVPQSGQLRIVNNLERGRLREVSRLGEHEGLIEPDFVYPLVSGRNIDRFGINSFAFILLPHLNKKGPHNAVPEDDLKVKYTATYEWLSFWKTILLKTREQNSKFYDPKYDPFYVLDNVGTYTFAPYKVAWKEQNEEMVACVLSTKPSSPLKGKLVIPDSKILFCPLEDEDEAHYLCAVLNSKIITTIIEGYTLELQRGIDILRNIKIPKYDPKNKLCNELSKLSKEAHENYLQGKSTEEIQEKINKTAKLFFAKT